MQAYILAVSLLENDKVITAAGLFLSDKSREQTFISAAVLLNPDNLPVISYCIDIIHKTTIERLAGIYELNYI